MASDEKATLQLVLTHCDMLLYNLQFTYSPDLVALGLLDPIPVFLNQFTFMHLFTTLFMVDGKDRAVGGAVYRVLQPLGLVHLLDRILVVIQKPVGACTFGDYLRINRNKLGVHGNLTFESLPPEVRAVTFDQASLDQYLEVGEEFEAELLALRQEIACLIEAGHNERPHNAVDP